MHIHGDKGPIHGQLPIRPNLPMERLPQLQGGASGNLSRLLTQLDAALFRSLSATDALKILEVMQRVSTPPAGTPAAATPLTINADKDAEAKPNLAGEHQLPGAELQTAASLHEQVDESGVILHAARFRAEVLLLEAETALSQPHSSHLAEWDAPPEALLSVSQDLYAQGGYMNYLRSGEVAQALMDALRPPVLVYRPSASTDAENTKQRQSPSWRLIYPRRSWLMPLMILLAVFLFYILLR